MLYLLYFKILLKGSCHHVLDNDHGCPSLVCVMFDVGSITPLPCREKDKVTTRTLKARMD